MYSYENRMRAVKPHIKLVNRQTDIDRGRPRKWRGKTRQVAAVLDQAIETCDRSET
jgi:hypothetical protein